METGSRVVWSEPHVAVCEACAHDARAVRALRAVRTAARVGAADRWSELESEAISGMLLEEATLSRRCSLSATSARPNSLSDGRSAAPGARVGCGIWLCYIADVCIFRHEHLEHTRPASRLKNTPRRSISPNK